MTRTLLAPEVVQTSAMDCGPAALKCLLDGHGLRVNYGRLRDACQTDVDGTSIDTMEVLANQLGLPAEQILIPVDHVLLPAAAALPAIAVVTLAERQTHFVVIWRRHGSLVQVMDPASGRRWLTAAQLQAELYVHRATVPAADWRAWAASPEFARAMQQRLERVGLSAGTAAAVLAAATADAGWRALARLDAATRMTQALIDAGGVRRGAMASAMLDALLAPDATVTIPPRYWTVVAAATASAAEPELVEVTGAVLVRTCGEPRAAAVSPADGGVVPGQVLESRSPGPWRELLALLRHDRSTLPVLAIAGLAAAAIVLFEALFFRSLIELGWFLQLPQQRVGAMVALIAFAFVVAATEFAMASRLMTAGRRLDTLFRLRILEAARRLGDRYFQTRLSSDLASRVHSLHQLRDLPPLVQNGLRVIGEAVATTAGLIWLDPDGAWQAMALGVVALGPPLVLVPMLAELDLRFKTHAGALSRYYLDALMGLIPLRTHAAERPLRREHARVLDEWARSGAAFVRASASVDGLQTGLGFAAAAWLLLGNLARTGEMSLLLAYWALRLPVLGDELVQLTRLYPTTRNVLLRLLEPLNVAAASPAAIPTPAAVETTTGGVAVRFDGVRVELAGHTILHDVSLDIAAGEHLAIVGPSGAGKSTLVGLLLGWYRATQGTLSVDGAPLDDGRLPGLRRQTAWVDPGVQLWNRSLIDNVRYGNAHVEARAAGFAVSVLDLQSLVQQLPDGLQTMLGENGGLVSGGEGQRVRLARGLLRAGVRLVILDEPFRGLPRDTRQALLEVVRNHWQQATLICITHDIEQARRFDRVVVIDEGTALEDGAPDVLLQGESRFRALLQTETLVRDELWRHPVWRQLHLQDGRLLEKTRPA